MSRNLDWHENDDINNEVRQSCDGPRTTTICFSSGAVTYNDEMMPYFFIPRGSNIIEYVRDNFHLGEGATQTIWDVVLERVKYNSSSNSGGHEHSSF